VIRVGLGICVLIAAGWLFLALFSAPGDAASAIEATSSRQCADCHAQVYAEWEGSQHAFSFQNPAVRSQSRDFANKDCIDCHAPRPVFETGMGQRVLPRTARRVEGVDCISCHLLPDGGVAGTITDPQASCRPVQRVELQRPELCAGCHDQHKTVQQWAASSWKTRGIGCLDCHMPRRDDDPASGRDHTCLGGNDLGMLQRAVQLRATRAGAGVAIEVENVGAGHAFPTDERSRAADLFWRSLAGEEPGPWQHIWRFRSPYRDETHLPETLLQADSTWRGGLEEFTSPIEVALFYKRSPYWSDPEAPDPEGEAIRVHSVRVD